MPRVSTSTVAILGVIAACGGKVLTDQGSQGGGAGRAGTGSGTFGSGTGSSGTSTSTGTGPGTGTGSTGTGISVTGAGGSNVPCGGTVCAPGWACCNQSCGICSPPGGGCIEIGCGSAGAFGQGGAFIGAGGGDVNGCVKPSSEPGLVASDMITDLETGPVVTGITPGGGWFSYKDPEVGAALLPDPANFMASAPGLRGTKMAVHVLGKGFMPPASATNFGGGVGIALSTPGPSDLSAFTGISFWAKSGSVVSDISVEIGTTQTDPTYCDCVTTGSCYAFHSVLFRSVPQAENRYMVRWTDLRQPDYVAARLPFDPTQILTIIFASNGPVPYFDYWIDEVSLTK